MKMILSLLISASTINALSQSPLPLNEAGRVEYTEIVKADSSSVSTLYSAAKLFIANEFRSAKDVTQLADDQAHTIVAKGLFTVMIKSWGFPFELKIRFQTTIQCKDNRYKYSITNFLLQFEHKSGPTSEVPIEGDKPPMWSKKQWESLKSQVDTTMKETISDLKKTMSSSAKNDW